MKVNMRYCTIAAIIAVVLFSVTIGLLMNSGQASYTRSPETWYWTTVQNTSYIIDEGTWSLTGSGSTEEARFLATSNGGIILVPIYAVNANPTLYIKHTTTTASGNLRIFSDGLVGSKQMANISLNAASAYNVKTSVVTNLSRGYSTLNITVETMDGRNDADIQAMWLE